MLKPTDRVVLVLGILQITLLTPLDPRAGGLLVQAQPPAPAPTPASQSAAEVDDEVPFIRGSWTLTYTFNEIRADEASISNTNPCKGPFPYKLRRRIDVFQVRGSPDIVYCFKGDNCAEQAIRTTLMQASVVVTQSQCTFRAHSIPARELSMVPNPFEEHPECGQGIPCISGSGEDRTHMYDMQPRCRLDQPCNPERAEQVPSRIFSAFQLPTAPPYVWGSLCRFYDYAERGDLNPTGDAPPYVGTWRHMNETFVVVRDLESCPGYSSASSKQQALFEACLTLPSGSSIAVPDAECFAKNSLGSVTDCGFKLVGTTGGCVSVGMHVWAIVYPESTTGLPRIKDDLFGDRPQMCWHYADLEGVKSLVQDDDAIDALGRL